MGENVGVKLPEIGKSCGKSILTVKGKTYKKKDIVIFKKYFDSIDEDHTGLLTLDCINLSVV